MPHISYSELRNWQECTWRHKLLYIDKLSVPQGSEHTCFGTAVHDTVELMLLGKLGDEELYPNFHKKFTEELKAIGIEEDTQLAKDMRHQVHGIFVSLGLYVKVRGAMRPFYLLFYNLECGLFCISCP